MFGNYIKSAYRNLWREKTYSAINIVGLSVGLAPTFIILIYSVHELTYDRYNKKLDRIYMVITNIARFGLNQPETPFPVGPTLKTDYPGIERFARCDQRTCNVSVRGKTISDVRCVSADSGIFKILTLPIVSGSLEDVYLQKNSAVISQRLNEKLFGGKDPVGQVIHFDWSGQTYDLKVAAVMANIPSTSTFKADCIVPIFMAGESLTKKWTNQFISDPLSSWEIPIVTTYVLVSSGTSARELAGDLAAAMKRHSQPNHISTYMRLRPIPLNRLYFHSSDMINVRFPKGNLTDVRVYSAIALLTLLMACVNFILFATGKASIRTKEIGMRKVVGASRIEIGKQVMCESLVVSLFSLPGAFLFVEIFMPWVSELLGKQLPSDYYHNAVSMIVYLVVTIVAGILSGSYVSFYLSGFQPAGILRNKLNMGQSRVVFRRFLISFQMIIFVGLITASLTIYRQMRYSHDKNMGFDTRNLVVFSAGDINTSKRLGERFHALRQELISIQNVQAVSGGNLVPGTQSYTESTVRSESNREQTIVYQRFLVSRDFFKALGMKMVWGRTFAQVPVDEAEDAVIMNQSAIRAIGIKDPSKYLFYGQRVLGIVKDFNMHSLYQRIAPTVFLYDTIYVGEIAVRLRHSKNAPQTIALIEETLEKFDGGKKLTHQYFNDRVNDMYQSDYKFADMIGYFTGLAIFVACLGLFGMSLFVIQMRVKEVGVRKVLGASVGSIFISLAKEFIALLVVSTLVAVPVSTYFTEYWLRHYAYHINVNVISVLASLIVGVLIVLVTIGYQALKAATANPVESLRYE